ncbi:MAG: Sulfate adenylyltransferase subunit 1 [Phycisphaerae bacterium]|nr:Sulfate adenylyltransferase subunit 1 [Phycisphaerae bacterium]
MTPPAEPVETLRLAIVGHVDHGKSTLIGRLLLDAGALPRAVRERLAGPGRDPAADLAFVTDHLREEREQARTIDTAQIFFRHCGRQYVIIDTPGHAEFIKNMFTGASRADAAVLLVDATESVRPQTRAHAQVLALLGISPVIPLVNKMDRVGYDAATFDAVAGDIARLLKATGLSAEAAIPASALTGDNILAPSPRMAWHRGPTLLDALAAVRLRPAPDDGPMRFAVQDVYDIDSRAIFVGRVESGVLRAGQDTTLLPDGGAVRVESIELFEAQRTQACIGEAVGVTLRPAPGGRARGLILADPADPPAVSPDLCARLLWMSPQPLAVGQIVELRIATQDAAATVRSIAGCFDPAWGQEIDAAPAALAYGRIATVRLEADRPLAREPFERGTALGRLSLARAGNVVGAGAVVA